MNKILTMMKKEFLRFFKDKRMVISILMLGIIIYIVYSVMGSAFSNMINPVDKDYKCSAYVIDMPQSLNATLSSLFELKSDLNLEEAKTKVKEGELDLVVVFPKNFDESLKGNLDQTQIPNVEIYYSVVEDTSSQGYNIISLILSKLQNPSPYFSINKGNANDGNLAENSQMGGKILSMMMPMLLVSLLVSGCMAVATESIAGEKEKGTIATILMTPVKRWQIALAKIASLSVLALISATSSFLGVILSLPKMLSASAGSGVDIQIPYGVSDYAMIFVLIISVTLVIVSLFSVISTYAKNVKEAGLLSTPIVIFSVVVGVLTMVIKAPATGLFAIPLFGSIISMSAVFSQSVTALAFVLAVLSNVFVAIALTALLGFMFKSEKIMFNK